MFQYHNNYYKVVIYRWRSSVAKENDPDWCQLDHQQSQKWVIYLLKCNFILELKRVISSSRLTTISSQDKLSEEKEAIRNYRYTYKAWSMAIANLFHPVLFSDEDQDFEGNLWRY